MQSNAIRAIYSPFKYLSVLRLFKILLKNFFLTENIKKLVLKSEGIVSSDAKRKRVRICGAFVTLVAFRFKFTTLQLRMFDFFDAYAYIYSSYVRYWFWAAIIDLYISIELRMIFQTCKQDAVGKSQKKKKRFHSTSRPFSPPLFDLTWSFNNFISILYISLYEVSDCILHTYEGNWEQAG